METELGGTISEDEVTEKRRLLSDDDKLVPISHKIPALQKRYLQILAIETSRHQRDLLSEAISMLAARYGSLDHSLPRGNTPSEIEAFRLIHSENPRPKQSDNVTAAADHILELAEKIKDERETASS